LLAGWLELQWILSALWVLLTPMNFKRCLDLISGGGDVWSIKKKPECELIRDARRWSHDIFLTLVFLKTIIEWKVNN